MATKRTNSSSSSSTTTSTTTSYTTKRQRQNEKRDQRAKTGYRKRRLTKYEKPQQPREGTALADQVAETKAVEDLESLDPVKQNIRVRDEHGREDEEEYTICKLSYRKGDGDIGKNDMWQHPLNKNWHYFYHGDELNEFDRHIRSGKNSSSFLFSSSSSLSSSSSSSSGSTDGSEPRNKKQKTLRKKK